eukprot:CAMPEP_0170598430 /NCGR_PEP_ID=MMETSP0224-20130122/16246_1 /TAXON_ID=285029 /ORGANISM="Togula jolla, Strain CCCM 725" /LENGTH=371 /DNA_ID=CAMNT_0010922987 /DNA_START=15 /DNA_END=1130 /DNA_ORIENTATION=+
MALCVAHPGVPAHAPMDADDTLSSQVARLEASLKDHQELIQVVESRQELLDRRLAEFGSLLQGFQEEHCARDVARAVESKRSFGLEGVLIEEGLEARVAALQRGQQVMAASVHRALQTALSVREKKQEEDFSKCLEDLGASGPRLETLLATVDERLGVQDDRIEKQEDRMGMQDKRFERVISMVDALAEKFLYVGGGNPDQLDEHHRGITMDSNGSPQLPHIPEMAKEQAESISELGRRVGELETGLMYTIANQSRRQATSASATGIEAIVDTNLHRFGQRLDALQDNSNEQRVALRQTRSQVQDVSKRLDQLSAQCQHYFPRFNEHDVHFKVLQTTFESHKEHVLDLADRLESQNSMDRGRLLASHGSHG